MLGVKLTWSQAPCYQGFFRYKDRWQAFRQYCINQTTVLSSVFTPSESLTTLYTVWFVLNKETLRKTHNGSFISLDFFMCTWRKPLVLPYTKLQVITFTAGKSRYNEVPAGCRGQGSVFRYVSHTCHCNWKEVYVVKVFFFPITTLLNIHTYS